MGPVCGIKTGLLTGVEIYYVSFSTNIKIKDGGIFTTSLIAVAVKKGKDRVVQHCLPFFFCVSQVFVPLLGGNRIVCQIQVAVAATIGLIVEMGRMTIVSDGHVSQGQAFIIVLPSVYGLVGQQLKADVVPIDAAAIIVTGGVYAVDSAYITAKEMVMDVGVDTTTA